MSDKEKKVISGRTCEVSQYWEFMDCDNIDVIVDRIQTLTNLDSWCIINHDKDTHEDGTPKPPHFHCVLTFSNNKTFNSIAKAVGVLPQYVEKIKKTTRSAQLYLIHKNDPEKYQYSPFEVKASFDYVKFVEKCKTDKNRQEIAELIDSGKIKEYNLFDYVSNDNYAVNKVYYQRCFEHRQNKLRRIDRQMECIYITGPSGTGKTTFAKMYATKLNYSVLIEVTISNLHSAIDLL